MRAVERGSSNQKVSAGREDEVARRLANLLPALETLTSDLDSLIPAWIARLREQLETMRQNGQRHLNALAAREKMPAIDFGNIIAVGQLQIVLQAAGELIDPHISPIIDDLATLDCEVDHHLLAVLEYAGPAVAAAIPKLLHMLRERGITRCPSRLARALANASRFDEGVLLALTELLSSGPDHARHAAIEVLAAIGPAGQSAAGQLLALRNGSEADRCRMIHELAMQGTKAPKFLGVLESALRDQNGYVRRSAIYALGELTPDPLRFVPLLIAACDWAEFLHDESLPEAAVAALGQYGPRAHAALPRLRQFIDGPIEGRTVRSAVVREAIEHISAGATAAADARAPRIRTQPLADDEPLFAVRLNDKQCYIDRLGQLVLKTRFSWGQPFSADRAIVHDDKRRTFVIDREGRDVFESTWDDIQPFSEGLAAVKKDELWGFVDQEGRVVIEPKHDSVTPFAEGLAGFEVGRAEESLLSAISWSRPGLRGFIDRSGTVVIPAEWADAHRFREGRAVVCTGGTMKPNPISDAHEFLSNRKYGYLDRAGRLLIPGDYDLAWSFSEGLAVVQIGDGIYRARYGYIDANGNKVIPLSLTSASSFKDGLALVRRRGRKWREITLVIDPAGKVVLEVPHRVLEPFSEGLAAVWPGEAYGFIDIEGHWVIKPQFDQVEPFKNGLAEVQRGDWYGLIDKAGKFIWGPTTEGGVNRVFESEWTS